MKILNSFGFAINGIITAFKMNLNLKIHLVIAILVIIAGLLFNLSQIEFILVIVLISLVFSAEMINCALEEVVNLLIKEHSIEAKIAKDVSAGMVLVVSIAAFICGFIIFLPYIFPK
jgi:diacylglycerol kinase